MAATPVTRRVGGYILVPACLCALVVCVSLLASSLGGDTWQQRTLEGLVYLVVAIGMYTYSGTSGAISFGHVSFMAIGAYTYALLTIPVAQKAYLFPNLPGPIAWMGKTEWATIPALLFAGAVAGVVGALVAPGLIRLSKAAISVASLALLLTVNVLVTQADAVTRGASSVVGVPPSTTLGLALAVSAAAIVVAYTFQVSRSGLRLRASREDLSAARSIGVRVSRERAIAWILSAVIAGIGGALFAGFLPSFGPNSFFVELTFLIVAMQVIGGLTSLTGTVIGVLFVTVVSQLLRSVEANGVGPIGSGGIPGLTDLGLAVLLILVLIWRPDGLTGGREINQLGYVEQLRSWRHARSTPAPALDGAVSGEDAQHSSADSRVEPALPSKAGRP